MNFYHCTVNGNYTEWGDWSTCSHSCGPGFMVRSRTCTNPSPSSGGFDCTRLGKPVQSTQCYLVDCPIDGNYTAWSNWTTCSATCGEGTKTRTRSCTNPSPLHGGRDCTELGSNIEIKPCKEQNCLGKYWNAEVVINEFPCVHSERELSDTNLIHIYRRSEVVETTVKSAEIDIHRNVIFFIFISKIFTIRQEIRNLMERWY